MSERSTVDVAFELARTGRFTTMAELKKALDQERCDQVTAHLSSPSLKAQLLRVMAGATH